MKKLRGLVLLLAAALLLGSVAMAAGNLLRIDQPGVVYDAGAEEFSFSIPGRVGTTDTAADDLFPEFKGLMPGDTRTQTVQVAVENVPSGSETELFLHADIPNDADKALLAPLTVTVTQDGEALSPEEEIGASLTDQISLGVFSSDRVSNLEVTLKVPATVGNEVMDEAGRGKSGQVNWVFTAQTLPSHNGTIKFHPVDIISYAGSGEAPTLRFWVELPDGQPWDGAGLTFTFHDSDTGTTALLRPVPVPEAADGYFSFPVLEGHLKMISKNARQMVSETGHTVHAGLYSLFLDEPTTWYIDAKNDAGDLYRVRVVPKGVQMEVRPVADEAANDEILTEVVTDIAQAPIPARAAGDSLYGGHKAVAVVPEGANYYTNGIRSGLGLVTAADGEPSIALLFDEPLTLSGELQPEDIEALMKAHAGHAGEWGGSGGFSFDGWESDFRYLDLVNTDDGNAWVVCDQPVTVYWPYPADIAGQYQNYEFQVLHYEGLDRDYFRTPLTDAEEWGQSVLCGAKIPVRAEAVTATANGLRFTLPIDPDGRDFSPFVLMWREKSAPAPDHGYTRVTVKKVWKLDDGGTAPDAVMVALLRNGREYATVRLSADTDWSHTWRNLNDRYRWTVEEWNVPEGFTASIEKKGTTFTITNDDVPVLPTATPTGTPSAAPSVTPTGIPSAEPTPGSSDGPSPSQSPQPTGSPDPSAVPSATPSATVPSSEPAEPTPSEPGPSFGPVDPTPSEPGPSSGPVEPTPSAPGPSSGPATPTPSASTGTHPGPKLPQTGQDWWPVFLMAAAGVVLLRLGLNMGKAGKGKHET